MGSKKRKPQPVSLLETTVNPDPIRQLQQWLDEAQHVGLREPAAMTLATATRSGRPSARIVLLKGMDENGLLFFTNFESRKGRELGENPTAALLFYWDSLFRQVRIEGQVVRTTKEESENYFRTRPRLSRIGAWASRQSSVIPDRLTLEAEAARYDRQFGNGEIPLPSSWGGYRLIPDMFEFWQSRENRLHDRLRYTRVTDGWNIDRLAP